MTDYHINLFYSEEDSAWVADIPDLPCCSAIGGDAEEALREVLVARSLWLAVAREEGRAIPVPRYRPAIYEAAA